MSYDIVKGVVGYWVVNDDNMMNYFDTISEIVLYKKNNNYVFDNEGKGNDEQLHSRPPPPPPYSESVKYVKSAKYVQSNGNRIAIYKPITNNYKKKKSLFSNISSLFDIKKSREVKYTF